jgi:hypothetical protein
MSIEIIVAILSAGAIIIAAVITAVATNIKKRIDSNTKPNFISVHDVKGNNTIIGNKNIVGAYNNGTEATIIPASISINDISGNQSIVGNNNEVKYYMPSKDDSSVQIVDVEFIADKDGNYIDIKLRNIGDRIAFIKKIIFTMDEVFPIRIPQRVHYMLVPSTATYNVVLNEKKQQSFSLSQSVEANDVDRFRIKVASSIAETRSVTIYYFSFALLYDENNKTTDSQKYIACFPSTSEWAACTSSHFEVETAKKNYLELIRLSKLNGIKTDHFLSILESYKNAKDDFM